MSDLLLVDPDDVLIVQEDPQPQVIDSQDESLLVVEDPQPADVVEAESEVFLTVQEVVEPDLLAIEGEDQIVTVGEVGPPGPPGGGGAGATNLSATVGALTIVVASDTGTDATLPAATGALAGLMLPAQVTKLAGIAEGATANSDDAALLERANHTGEQAIGTVTGLQAALDLKASTTAMTAADAVVQAHSIQRVNHTGTQAAATITEDATHRFATDAEKTAWNAKQEALGFTPVDAATIGAAGGVAPLDGTSKIAAAYLPSYVDDVLEFADLAALPATGETGVIYVTLDSNWEYRWSGTVYVRIVASPGTTDEVTEGAGNLYFTAARVRSTVLTGLSLAAATIVDATHTVLQALGFLQKQVSDNLATLTGHTGSTANPHSVTKAQVGLTSVTDDAQTKAAIVPNTAPAAGQILVGNAGGTAFAKAAVSGDATLESTGALTITNAAVTLAKMANMATASVFYRKTAASGAPEVQTLATLKTDLGLTGTNSGDQSVREKLTAARSYYVRTDGNDSNSGLVDDGNGAFLTIQKAIDTAVGLDNNGYDVTINIGAGTWTVASVLKSIVGAGKIIIRGTAADMTSTVISTTSADCFDPGTGFDGVYSIQYMKLQTTTSGNCIGGGFGGGGVVQWENVAFGTCAGQHIKASQGQIRRATGAYTINGNAIYHWGSYDGGQVRVQGVTVTLTGTPAFSAAFAGCDRTGTILPLSVTFSGSATGSRYAVTLNGSIYTAGAGASYLPGDSAGTTATGGQYA